MSRHLCIRLIQKLLQIFFFRGFKNHLILILLDSQNLTKYNQSLALKRVNIQFQLEDHISGVASLAPKRNQSLLSMLKFKSITRSRLFFLENKLAFFLRELFLSIRLWYLNLTSVLIQEVDCWDLITRPIWSSASSFPFF